MNSNRITYKTFSLDDEDYKKWLSKWRGVYWSSQTKNVICDLTFKEYLSLVVSAGITKPSMIGKKFGTYQLARYGDVGGYTFTNCRYILTEDNIHERKINGGTDRISAFAREFQAREFILTSPTGEIYMGKDVKAFCDEHPDFQLQDNSLRRMLRGERNHHKGWHGHYTD